MMKPDRNALKARNVIVRLRILKKARKQGEERTNNAAPEGREHSEAMNRAEGDESAPAPRDEQKQSKDPKEKPPKDGKPPKDAPAEE